MANPLNMEEVNIKVKLGDSKATEKQYAYIQNARKAVEKALLRNQCACIHQKKRRPAVKRRNGPNGEIQWVCYRCGKQINLQAIDSNKLRDASDTVQSAADVVKMMANPELDKDISVIKDMAKLQWIISGLQKRYEAVTNPNKKRKKGTNNNRQGGSTWQ